MTQPTDSLDNSKLVTVAERADEMSATILVSVLADEGIRAIATGGFTSGFRAEAPGMVQVKTFEADAALAREIIAEIKMLPSDEMADET
ncbi:DUF2007 domain-containing protein [Stieleria varia]|uniref:Uncharacterized protein n=1 Tax=Stieleria varia TaxID=2528005 RepID=A0A5C6AFY7_9BACT|nr:DUF2007 domain-containing protein [Stieleria varia]TWT98326.1 hypothetical protein Pla52n_48380 [Stieleria varia]